VVKANGSEMRTDRPSSPPRVAQTGALMGPFAEMPKRHAAFLSNVGRGWRTGCRCIHYLLLGPPKGVPGLVDFVCGDHFLSAGQVVSELAALGEILAARRPERALEIGTARGGTLLFLCGVASPQATIISVDLQGGKFGGGYGRTQGWLYKRFARRKQRLQLLQGDSHSRDILDKVKAALRGQELDYLFIDGDHSYPGVKCDFEMYGPMVRKGGLIAFHDIVEGPPETVGGAPRLWGEIKSKYRHIEIIKAPPSGRLRNRGVVP